MTVNRPETNRDKRFGRTDIFMLLATLFWAVNFSIIKIALREFSPSGFNGLRFLFSSLLLLLVLWGSGEGFFLSWADSWKALVLGLVGVAIYQTLFIHGISLTSASNTSLIMAMTPVLIALMSSFFRIERISPAGWAGIFISFIGLYLVVTKQTPGLEWTWKSLKGDSLIFAGNICWAAYTVFSKPLLKRIPPLKLCAWTMFLGTLLYLPFVVKDIRDIPWARLSLTAWASLLYSGLFAIVISCVIWFASLKKVGNAKTGIYGNITPVFAALFAYFFLAERITVFQIVGALIIFSGFYLTRSNGVFAGKKRILSDTSRGV
jgi:drug/metabolite transporter (DMT)-like permease